jgi:hypothetical protein
MSDGTMLRTSQQLGQLALTVQRLHEGLFLSATVRSRFSRLASRERWWQGELSGSMPVTENLSLNVELTATMGDAGRFAAQAWSSGAGLEYRSSIGLTLWRGMGREASPLLSGQ